MSDCILIVDDDPATSDVLRLFLEHEGHNVIVAAEGGEALRLLREQGPPSLILLDLGMPGLDGWGFMDVLARHPEWSGVPVVVLTGDKHVTPGELLALGADDLLHKPVTPEELLATVDRYSWAG
jgi:CheY-like chemotaxis protein